MTLICVTNDAEGSAALITLFVSPPFPSVSSTCRFFRVCAISARKMYPWICYADSNFGRVGDECVHVPASRIGSVEST